MAWTQGDAVGCSGVCHRLRMKVRIGYALGAVPSLYPQARRELAGLGPVVDDLDRLGFDSLWFPERINSMQLDPIVAMAYVAGRSEHLKFGPAVSVVPGRNPILMAKMLASLDVVVAAVAFRRSGSVSPTPPSTRRSRSTARTGHRG